MTVEHKTTHVEEAATRWTDAFRDKEKLQAFLAAYVAEVQELEDAAQTLRVLRRLDNATGVQLDIYGRIVKLERLGLGDDEYRAMIKIWIYANRAHGVGNNIIHVLVAALGEDFDFRYDEYPPRSQLVDLLDALDLDERVLARLLKRVRMGGVNTQMIWSPRPPEEVFTFASGDVPEASTTQGFAGIVANALLNPGFEDGDTSAWDSEGGTSSIVEDPANARTGDWVMETTGSFAIRHNDAFALGEEGAPFAGSAWFKGLSGGQGHVAVRFFTSLGAFISSSSVSSGTLTSSYEQVAVSGACPAGTAGAQLVVSTSDGPDIFTDDASLIVGIEGAPGFTGGRLAHVEMA